MTMIKMDLVSHNWAIQKTANEVDKHQIDFISFQLLFAQGNNNRLHYWIIAFLIISTIEIGKY